MRIKAIALMGVLAGAVAAAENAGLPRERNVTVCLEGNADPAGAWARSIAGAMFAALGVTVDWRLGLPGCPPQGVIITLDYDTPESLRPGSLGYAEQRQGSHIRIFHDRIVRYFTQASVANVLAYVLVHEITHVLQGVNRHSEHGIMKARWDVQDYARMRWLQLQFDRQDIELIYSGLRARAGLASVAVDTTRRTIVGP